MDQMGCFAVWSLVLFLYCSPTALAQSDCRDVSGTYDYEDVTLLEASTNYYAQSLVDDDDFVITLSVDKSSGFVGFGIPEQTSGSMLGADIVSVGFDIDGVYIADYYVPFEGFPFAPVGGSVDRGPGYEPVSTAGSTLYPRRDCENGGTDDWTLISAAQDIDGTNCQRFTLKRKLTTGDVNDRDIVSGEEMRVIWALGSFTEPTYHGSQRGGSRIQVGPSSNSAFECNPPECFFRDYTFDNHEIQPIETTYVNMDFKALLDSEVGVDYHMIRFEVIVDPNSVDYVHHLLLNGCYGNSSDKNLNFTHEYYQVYDGFPDTRNPECETQMYVWAVGGEPLILPEEAGFPVGDLREDQVRYFSLNFHFTNPQEITGLLDNSGVRVYFTTEKRPNDAGVLLLGTVNGEKIPRQDELYSVQSTCPSNCTEGLPTLNVFASFLHMHSFGQRIWSAHYDANGNLKRYTNRIDFWNFQWQKTTLVDFQIVPGDYLQTFCVFNTSKWNTNVSFGLSSFDEMCVDYLYHWPVVPKLPLLSCGTKSFKEEDQEGSCPMDGVAGIQYVDVPQVKMVPGDAGFEFEPTFSTLQSPVECLPTFQARQTSGGEADNLPWEIIIGASAGGGALLLLALLVVIRRILVRRKMGSSVRDDAKVALT